MCGGALNGGELTTVDAANYLARGKPEAVCPICEKPLLLVVVVSAGDEGRAQLAELEVA
jgi:hypothetical protein